MSVGREHLDLQLIQTDTRARMTGEHFWYGFLELGGCLTGVTICYTKGLQRSLDFACDYFGEPIPGFDLI